MAATEETTAAEDARVLTDAGRERKAQLVACAAELFAERGFAETRIKDIVDAAGVAKGLFYWYFENKEALFAEVAASIRLQLRRAQAEAVDPAGDPIEQLRDGTVASVRFMAEHAAFFSLLEVETDALGQESRREGTDQHVRDVGRLISAGIEAGLIVDEDPRLLALGVVGLVGTFSHYHRSGRTGTSLEALERHVADLVVRMVAADGEIAAARALPR